MPEPKLIGKYEIVGTLGKGGMGVVYRALDPMLGRTVALKIIRKKDAGEEEPGGMLARFRNEARAAGRLNHPGIVTVYEFGEDGDVAYIAMEYIEGCVLKDYLLQHTRLPVADATNIMLQLLDGLHFAHCQNIIHRDIKPSNLMLTAAGKLKIADFGVARIDDCNLTIVGTLIGTPNYMAPEQFMGMPLDGRCDVFSAGVVFYELLTGHPPFSGSNESIAYQICHAEPPAPSSVASDLPPAFDGIAAKALRKEADQRFESAEAFSAAIHDAFVQTFDEPPDRAVSARTLVLAQDLRLRKESSRDARQGRHDTSSASGGGAASNWPEQELQTLERQLAAFIGPVARVLVHKAAAQTTDRHDLYRLLSNNLDDRSRQVFMATESTSGLGLSVPSMVAGGMQARDTDMPSSGASDGRLTGEYTEYARRSLAAYLGPIAALIVKQAERGASGRHDFLALLADKLNDDEERRRFLEDVAKYPASPK